MGGRRRQLTLVMVVIGGVLLLASTLASNAIAALAGLAVIFWGILLLFATATPYVKAEVIGPSFEGQREAVRQFLSAGGTKLNATYLPPRSFEDVSAGKVLLSAEKDGGGGVTGGASGLSATSGTRVQMPAPGLGLVKYYQKKAGSDFLGVDLQYVKLTLPNLVTEDLELARSLEVSIDGDTVDITSIGAKFYQLCVAMSDSAESESYLACPFHSSFALVLARATSKAVMIASVERMNDGETVKATYKVKEA